MAEAGVDVQSHTLTHPFLTKRRHQGLSDAQYGEWLRRELAESKRILEKESGKKVQFIAYPYGDYDTQVAKAVEKAGYTAALTCDFGRVRRGSDPLRMKRFVIDDKMDFAAFRKYLGATPLQLAEMTPKPGKVDPGITPVTTVSARIPGFATVDPKSVGMALLSLGTTVPYTYDARNGEVTLTIHDAISSLKAKYHRAIVWATDVKTGKRVEASWVFRLTDPSEPLPAVKPLSVVKPLPAVVAAKGPAAAKPAAPHAASSGVVAASVMGAPVLPIAGHGGGTPKQ